MKSLTQILSRLAAYAGASAIGAGATLLIANNPDWWMAALGAAAPHTLMIVATLLKSFFSDGKLTQDEIDAAFQDADVK